MNFVRGEDSFVRAQWAGRPFVWNIYPTADGAHWVKMAAFLTRYTRALDARTAASVAGLWKAWNRRPDDGPEHQHVMGAAEPAVPTAWPEFAARLEGLKAHAGAWSAELASRADLATQLVDFTDHVLE